MVNFRYHLVSLTAVFLALALGIAVGAGAVRQGTVDVLNKRLDSVERSVKKTNAENDQLRGDLGVWSRFADQGGNQLLESRLRGVAVLAVAVRGTDTKSFDTVRQAVVDAGATFEGTVWFTPKLKLAKADDVNALADALSLASTRPDLLRQAVVTRLADFWSGTSAANPLPGLVDSGFVEIENPPGGNLDVATPPLAGSLFLMASGTAAAVPNDALAVPLVRELAQRLPNRVEAVEATETPAPGRPAPPAFVAALRSGPPLKLTTVDDLDTYPGRVATVLSLDNLPAGKTGHYGVAGGADGLLPTTTR